MSEEEDVTDAESDGDGLGERLALSVPDVVRETEPLCVVEAETLELPEPVSVALSVVVSEAVRLDDGDDDSEAVCVKISDADDDTLPLFVEDILEVREAVRVGEALPVVDEDSIALSEVDGDALVDGVDDADCEAVRVSETEAVSEAEDVIDAVSDGDWLDERLALTVPDRVCETEPL